MSDFPSVSHYVFNPKEALLTQKFIKQVMHHISDNTEVVSMSRYTIIETILLLQYAATGKAALWCTVYRR